MSLTKGLDSQDPFLRRGLNVALSQKELQLRTNMEAQALEADLLRVTLVYQGWLNPNGELWSLSDFVTVKSPMLFPTAIARRVRPSTAPTPAPSWRQAEVPA